MIDSNSTILITGATGLIGSEIIRSILAYNKKFKANISIVAQVRNIKKAEYIFGNSNYITYIVGDIRDSIEYEENIDYLIHCASITSSKKMIDNPKETYSVAIDGTKNILDFAKKKNIRAMVYLSSMEVYGRTKIDDNPITEEKLGTIDEKDDRSCYPLSKRECEKMCREYARGGIPIRIVRLAQILGKELRDDDSRMPAQFIKCLINGKDIVLHSNGESIINYCHIDDAINGISAVLLNGMNGETYNVCNDSETRSVKEIAHLVAVDVADALGMNTIGIKYDIPAYNKYGFAPNYDMYLSSKKLRKLGWEPKISMIEGYKQIVNNYSR